MSPVVLVVSAHAADFVWRCGGYIAAAVAAGGRAEVVCLSFGERGESPGAWRQEGMTLTRVKEIRRPETEAEAAGAALGALLTHSRVDPYNYDHPLAADLTLRARMVAQARGHESAHPPLGAPPVFRFEPHQPEMCEFTPDVLVDISAVFDRKLAAMRQMGSQDHLVRYYTDLGQRRGVQAVRNGGPGSIRQAETFERVFPQVAGVLA